MLQGLVVGPGLLNRLINDRNKEVNSMLIKFTDSAKLGNTAYIPKAEKAIKRPEKVWNMVKILFWFIHLENSSGKKVLGHIGNSNAAVLTDICLRNNQNSEASLLESKYHKV